MRARGGTSDLTILVVVGVMMTVLTVIAFLLAPADSAPQIGGSSFSTGPDGTKGAYLVLKELGHDVERSYDPIAALARDPESTILVLANPIEKPSQQDQRAVQSFVQEGGTVIAYGPTASAFLPGVTAGPRALAIGPVRGFDATSPSSLTSGATDISARAIASPQLDAAYVMVFGSTSEPAVVSAHFGDGRVIWCLDHTPIQNDGLARAANVNLLANAAGVPGARTIAWDEHYHGARRSLVSYLAGTPLPWAAAQLALVAVVALAAVARRRGAVRARVIERRTSPLEFVDTMASLYERAGVERAAVEMSRSELRRRLASASGLPSSASDEQLSTGAAWRLGIDHQRIATALSASAEALRVGFRRREDAVAMVAQLQQLAQVSAAARAGRRLQVEQQ
jgi:hypothetical protein